MKLPQKDRERLYSSEGKPTEITWPEEETQEPRKGKRYSVYTENGTKALTIRVERVKGEEVIVKVDADPVRVLPGLTGQRNEQGDYEPEPERVHDSYEKTLAFEASQRNAVLNAEHRQEQRQQSKEARAGSTSRAERALKRHSKAIARVKVDA